MKDGHIINQPPVVVPVVKPSEGPKDEKASQTKRLLDLASEAELFHTDDKEAFVRIPVESHKEVWPIGSHFSYWLRGKYYESQNRSSPCAQSLTDALEQLRGVALFDGKKRSVHKRIAGDSEKIYVDLCNETWQVVEITSNGWRILKESPVMFVRSKGMSALPTPAEEGDIRELRRFINCTDRDFAFIVAWMLAAFSPSGPYPILEIGGEQGSAKSTLTRILKAITDPNRAPLNTMPTTEKDIASLTKLERTLAFDNVSSLSLTLSDTFCRLATGSAFKCRQLYSDSGQVVFELCAPVVMNGIEEIAKNGDLQERTLKVFLPAIESQGRKDEKAFWSDFDSALPGILGGLFTVLSEILRNLPTTNLDEKPRLADFSLWITAGENALGWDSGCFNRLYIETLREAKKDCADADDFVRAVIQIAKRNGHITLPGEKIVELLKAEVPDSRTMPSRRTLRDRLCRVAPTLRSEGVEWEYKKTSGPRLYALFYRPLPTKEAEQEVPQVPQIHVTPYPAMDERLAHLK